MMNEGTGAAVRDPGYDMEGLGEHNNFHFLLKPISFFFATMCSRLANMLNLQCVCVCVRVLKRDFF